MNTQYKEEDGPVEIIEPATQTATPGSNAAKFGILAAVSAVGLNWVGCTVLEGRSATLAVAGVAATVVGCAGLIAAAAALVKTRSCRDKNVILLAVAGLLLNGGLLAMGFAKVHIPAIRGRGPQQASAKELEASPLSSRSSRTIITTDWTAGFVIELTDRNFDDVISNSDIPVLVDFWAPWCGPCLMMGPVIEEIAEDYKGKAKVCKLNVDNARDTAAKFGISGIPTIILFKNGRVKEKWMGVTDKRDINSAINKLL